MSFLKYFIAGYLHDWNKYISFKDIHDPRTVIFKNCRYIFMGLLKGGSTKTIGIIQIQFGHCVGKYGPGSFCAGIGQLQLGVVLFFLKFLNMGPQL